MAKMTTISAKVTVDEKMRFQQMAKEKGVTVSDLIKQMIKTGKVFDMNALERLEELNRISNYIYQIKEYCVTYGTIDEQVLLALLRIEHDCKNI
jgi:hypothetical protein